jgi:hypothetical protein
MEQDEVPSHNNDSTTTCPKVSQQQQGAAAWESGNMMSLSLDPRASDGATDPSLKSPTGSCPRDDVRHPQMPPRGRPNASAQLHQCWAKFGADLHGLRGPGAQLRNQLGQKLRSWDMLKAMVGVGLSTAIYEYESGNAPLQVRYTGPLHLHGYQGSSLGRMLRKMTCADEPAVYLWGLPASLLCTRVRV